MNKENPLILGIETSCDETSAAVVTGKREILSNAISSQIELHKKYGGVVPEIASRKHMETINTIVKEALDKANVTLDDIDVIGVTYGPGLVGALLVGVSFAKALAFACKKPLVGVNHIEGHISANYIEDKSLEPPFICLVVSGGHSHIVHVKDYSEFEVLGRTRDDAAGEAFDKIARVLGLGYPGGPLIDKIARQGDPNSVQFPRVSFDNGSLDFSFSGVKTAVINHINQLQQKKEEIHVPNIAASFQQAVVDVLVDKSIKAAIKTNINKIALAGGVAANSQLRQIMNRECDKNNIRLLYPSPILCTDNAAMIAYAAYRRFLSGETSELRLNALPSLKLGDI